MSLYAIADLHLSFNTDKPMNVFEGWNNYTEKLELNWKKKVKENDMVVIAGDISWAMKLEDALEDLKFIDSLPGKKILIKGNHDYWWSTKTKIESFLKENNLNSVFVLLNSAVPIGDYCICGTKGYLDDGKENANPKLCHRETMRLISSIRSCKRINKKPIVFLHYPPIYADNECEEIMNVLIKEKIEMCYYGHIHSKDAHLKALNSQYKGIKFQLISCDYLNFDPLFII